MMSARDERSINDYLYYAFVRLNLPDGIPEFWIVPSKIVASVIKIGHKIWMEKTAKNGKPHQESNRRKFHLVPKYNFPEDWAEQLEYFKGNIEQLIGLK